MKLMCNAQQSMIRGGRLFKCGDVVEVDQGEADDLLASGSFEAIEIPKPKKPKNASSKSQNETEEK